jgi:hypothetical protein
MSISAFQTWLLAFGYWPLALGSILITCLYRLKNMLKIISLFGVPGLAQPTPTTANG